jgi:hypothetical protein
MVSSSKTTLVFIALLIACNVIQALAVKPASVLTTYKMANVVAVPLSVPPALILPIALIAINAIIYKMALAYHVGSYAYNAPIVLFASPAPLTSTCSIQNA